MKCTDLKFTTLIALAVFVSPQVVLSQSAAVGANAPARVTTVKDAPKNVLSSHEWSRVDAAVERGLDWLVRQQNPDGSFPTIDNGQPGVTSLCVMAFVSHGYVPGDGRYGKQLSRATDYILACQKQNGLITLIGPDGPRINRNIEHEVGTCGAYNHAISSLTLSELYGMSEAGRAERIEAVINKSLAASLVMQRWPKDQAEDRGGWRYIDDNGTWDSDLSITGWELMFLRSSRNAGFDVPEQPIAEAVAYIRRCFAPEHGSFEYANGDGDHLSRGMAGAGILALGHAGFHNSREAQQSGDWILRHGFDDYNVLIAFNEPPHDRYHYAVFNCCQGMYQLGGRHWEQFFPRLVTTLLANQQPDGSWPADSHWHDGMFGNAYTTSLVVISLGAPNQLLPIFQR
jgi:hypothetical protein